MSHDASSSIKPIHSEESFARLLAHGVKHHQLIVIKYGAAWCGPCNKIAPEVEKLAASYAHHNAPVHFASVDVDEASENGWDTGIGSLPTFHFYLGSAEKPVFEMKGAHFDKLRAKVAEWLDRCSS